MCVMCVCVCVCVCVCLMQHCFDLRSVSNPLLCSLPSCISLLFFWVVQPSLFFPNILLSLACEHHSNLCVCVRVRVRVCVRVCVCKERIMREIHIYVCQYLSI